MYCFETFCHDEFDKYAEDHLNTVINIANVLLALSKNAQSIPMISARINPPERKGNNRSTYDAHALVTRLNRWGYVRKEQNAKKYKSTVYFWLLTDKGLDLLRIMPKYLMLGIKKYGTVYREYQKQGLAS